MSIHSMSQRFNKIEAQWASVHGAQQAPYIDELEQMLVQLEQLPAHDRDAGEWLARRIKRMLRSPHP